MSKRGGGKYEEEKTDMRKEKMDAEREKARKKRTRRSRSRSMVEEVTEKK